MIDNVTLPDGQVHDIHDKRISQVAPWFPGENQNNPGVRMDSASAEGANATGEAFGSASGDFSHAEGNSTIAGGNSSHAEGGFYFEDDDIDIPGGVSHGPGSHAEGVETQTYSDAYGAHAEGVGTQAEASGSHAEGGYIVLGQERVPGGDAAGRASHAEGLGTYTQNDAEHAEGKYNKSNKKTNGTDAQNAAGSTLHSVGIGTGTNRKNAFEIMHNGDMYINDVGGYDGTNPGQTHVLTLQSLLNIPVLEENVIGDDADIYVNTAPLGIIFGDTCYGNNTMINTKEKILPILLNAIKNILEQEFDCYVGGLDVIKMSNFYGIVAFEDESWGLNSYSGIATGTFYDDNENAIKDFALYLDL